MRTYAYGSLGYVMAVLGLEYAPLARELGCSHATLLRRAPLTSARMLRGEARANSAALLDALNRHASESGRHVRVSPLGYVVEDGPPPAATCVRGLRATIDAMRRAYAVEWPHLAARKPPPCEIVAGWRAIQRRAARGARA